MIVDPRDWNAWRDRLLKVEEEQRAMRREMALYQQGCKERLDVISVLLSRLEDAVARKDLG